MSKIWMVIGAIQGVLLALLVAIIINAFVTAQVPSYVHYEHSGITYGDGQQLVWPKP